MLQNALHSIIRFAQDQIDTFKVRGHTTDMAFLNLDDHANIEELPAYDILGLSGFAITEDEKFHVVDAGLAVLTFNDVNLFRHYEMLNHLYKALAAETVIPVYDAETATRISWMQVLNGTSAPPMGRAGLRPVQFVTFSAAIAPVPVAAS